ncbi:LysM peptidoglycan-binding domain-containing protein [Psychrobacillus sp. FSL H8-0483]|uniref:LysM peptidoglycan-binding domain-containing protein n=1 Tax=Psychrobacillus sp. FSL H8-0483 TaxID=2921389 RepID=UPI00315A0607
MKQDDYQKKIDEHRQSISLEDDSTELRRSRRSNSSKKAKKKSKNVLIPTLFGVFILIPIFMFIYVYYFFTPEEEEVTDPGIIQMETKTISNGLSKQEEAKETVDENTEGVEQTPVTTTETEEKEETKNVENLEEKKETQVETSQQVQANTHTVGKGETLYRIAMNYYNNPDAVEKIKDANGLSSNEISVGQKLILP